jgi:hypothetical protein
MSNDDFNAGRDLLEPPGEIASPLTGHAQALELEQGIASSRKDYGSFRRLQSLRGIERLLDRIRGRQDIPEAVGREHILLNPG